ncbi:MAG TPA: ABC transporter ATP-binding protein [Dongiaceae bacterium]
MPHLSLRHVGITFPLRHGGETVAVEDLSLEVGDGEFSVIVGPSGCGKSTLLRLVAGLARPSRGEILLDDLRIEAPGRERGMVFQSYTLFPWLTVQRNVEFGLRVGGLEQKGRAEIARARIAEVGLQGFEKAYPSQLSGGMQQRVALARALANDPKVLLMDEPFGALDAQTRSLMQELLLGVWEKAAKTVLFITHDVDEALFLGDRVHVMTARPGRIKEQIEVPIPRPRSIDVLTSGQFNTLKRQVMESIREEAQRSFTGAA